MPLSDGEIDRIIDAVYAHSIAHFYQQGDVIVLDNHTLGHGKVPGGGPGRRISTIMLNGQSREAYAVTPPASGKRSLGFPALMYAGGINMSAWLLDDKGKFRVGNVLLIGLCIAVLQLWVQLCIWLDGARAWCEARREAPCNASQDDSYVAGSRISSRRGSIVAGPPTEVASELSGVRRTAMELV